MTIREAITKYEETKAKALNRDFLDVVNNTSLCIIIPMNNGVRISIDTHPEADYLKEKYPLEMPNKNGVFKRVSFEILDDGIAPILPISIKDNITTSLASGVAFYVNCAKERVINEFINFNGGINEEKFTYDIIEQWA